MKKTHRVLVGLLAASATLAFASAAFATYAPKLVVSQSGATQVARIGVVVGASDDPTAKTTIFVPNGYTVSTPAPNTVLGAVTATAAAADLGGAVLPLTGSLIAIAPTSTTTAEAQTCGVAPTQTWDLHLSAAGQTLDIPVFVVTATAPVTTVGYTTELVVCLPPPDVPAGTPGRATFGAKLLSTSFVSSAITQPTAAGDYRWTSTFTPYTPNTGQPNAAGTVETQAIRDLPVKVGFAAVRKRIVHTAKVKVKGKTKTVKQIVTGVGFDTAVLENGKQTTDFTATVTSRGKKLGGAKGAFTMFGLKSTTLNVVVLVDSDSSVPTGTPAAANDLFYHDLGGTSCVATPIFQGIPCIDATVGGERSTGSLVVKAFTK